MDGKVYSLQCLGLNLFTQKEEFTMEFKLVETKCFKGSRNLLIDLRYCKLKSMNANISSYSWSVVVQIRSIPGIVTMDIRCFEEKFIQSFRSLLKVVRHFMC